MKKKIAILGSTGSIGENLLRIIKKDKKNFEIVLITANRNYKKLFNQAKEFNVKNLIINDKKSYELLKNKAKKSNINIYNNYNNYKKIFRKKIDYVMSSIIGLDGLHPTLKIIKHTKKIAIANKESLICAWNLINNELQKNKTSFIPIDSEHYSIFELLKNHHSTDVEKIYITASGGPFLNYPKKKFKFIKPKNALKHPNWKMGKKISIDSSTLMNKVFEVIEAKNIFNIPFKKISILIHPQSYMHAIVKFKNGIIKVLLHDPDMIIPIYNSVYENEFKKIKLSNLNLNILNNLQLKKVDLIKFPIINILNKMHDRHSLFETVIITVNDFFVHKFLDNKINYEQLIKKIIKLIQLKEFNKYKRIKPKSIEDIYKLKDYVSLKLSQLSI